MHQPREVRRSQAINVPVPQNTPVGPINRRHSRSLDGDDVKYVETLFYKQHIGSETRIMEFKRGTGQFADNVRRNACAFLNSDGGRLMLGVDDQGLVLGNNIEFKRQDQWRQRIDEILKNFKPPVMPHNYSVEFLPVLPGVEEIPPGERPNFTDLKVLCVTLTPHPVHRQSPSLYQTDKNKVFIRRNGKVDEMNASAMNEWYLQMWTQRKFSKVEQLTKENEELKRGIMKALRTKQEISQDSPPIHQKRKMTEPASDKAGKKSPKIESKSGDGKILNLNCMEMPVLKIDGDDKDLKVEVGRLTKENKQLTKENKQLTKENEQLRSTIKDLQTKQESSQDRHPRRLLALQNTAKMPENKRRRIPSGGGDNHTVGRPQSEESDGREIMPIQDKLHKMLLR